MDKKITRAFIDNNYFMGNALGPQTVVVRQVIGERETQKVLDIHVRVPDRKPAIEQIIDVFVKNLKVLHIDVITDRIVVRGELEVKAIYVADLPDQPVHAVELKHYKFSQEVDIPGARRGMDAEASVSVDFVDYDVAEYTRAYKYKNYEHINCFDPCEEEEDDEDECPEECAEEVIEEVLPVVETKCEVLAELATREFDVSIVLSITAKVMTDRELILGAIEEPQPVMPVVPPPAPPKPKPAAKPATKKPAPPPAPKPKLPMKPKG
jgi:hypothetical protein